MSFWHNNQLFEMNCWWTCLGNLGGKWSATWSMRQFWRKHYIPLNLKVWAYEDVKDVRARLISSSVSPSRVQSIRHFGWHPGFCFCQTSKIGKEPGQVGVCRRMIHPLVRSIRSHFFAALLDTSISSHVLVMSIFQRCRTVGGKVRLTYWFVESIEQVLPHY